jgi:hypothetical protein
MMKAYPLPLAGEVSAKLTERALSVIAARCHLPRKRGRKNGCYSTTITCPVILPSTLLA